MRPRGHQLDNDASRVENNLISGNTAYRGGGIHTWFNEEDVGLWTTSSQHSTLVRWRHSLYDYHTVTIQRNEIPNEAPYGGGICTYDYVDLVVKTP